MRFSVYINWIKSRASKYYSTRKCISTRANPVPKFGYFRLVEVAKKMTRFAIKSITVYGSRICVASFTDSITFYDYDPEHKTIEFVKRYGFAFFKDHLFLRTIIWIIVLQYSDATSRTVNHSLMVDEHLAVGTLGLGDCIFLHDVSGNEKLFSPDF